MIDQSRKAEDLIIDKWTQVSKYLGIRIVVNVFVPELNIVAPIHIPDFGGERGSLMMPLRYARTEVYDKASSFGFFASFSTSDGDRSCIPILEYIKELSEFEWMGEASQAPAWLLSDPYPEDNEESVDEKNISEFDRHVIYVNCSEEDFGDDGAV